MSHFFPNPTQGSKTSAHKTLLTFIQKWWAHKYKTAPTSCQCVISEMLLINLADILSTYFMQTNARPARPRCPSSGERHCLLRAQEANMTGQSKVWMLQVTQHRRWRGRHCVFHYHSTAVSMNGIHQCRPGRSARLQHSHRTCYTHMS